MVKILEDFAKKNITKVDKVEELSSSIADTKKLKVGYKFGLEFLNSKNGRSFVSKIKKKIIFVDLKLKHYLN